MTKRLELLDFSNLESLNCLPGPDNIHLKICFIEIVTSPRNASFILEQLLTKNELSPPLK